MNQSRNQTKDERRAHPDYDAFFNAQFDAKPVRVPPGAYECLDDPGKMLVADVGSGVLICVHDPGLNLAGMCHFLLPESVLREFSDSRNVDAAAVEYAENLIECLIRSMKHFGAGKGRVRLKVFGGSTVLEDIIDSGLKNYIFARGYLLKKGLNVASADIGGDACRRVHFLPEDGRTVRYLLRRDKDREGLRTLEKAFLSDIDARLEGIRKIV